MVKTLAEDIAHHLRRDILRGRLGPGAPLKERDNAAELGVSRTPMREAIRILAQDGLVELRPARSPVVANPSAKEILDSIEILVALEELSGRLAVRHATDEEIAEIRSQHERLAEQYDHLDAITRFEEDMAFHVLVAKASHNEELVLMHSRLLARMWRARYGTAKRRQNRARVVDQHGQIIAALEARNAEATVAAIKFHLEHFLYSTMVELTEAGLLDAETSR